VIPPSLKVSTKPGQLQSAKHCSLVEWAKVIATKIDLVTVGGAVRLFLSFGSDRSNIGNISSGVVKSFIDCMYPLYGGKFGHPDDWRIEHLTVEKGVSTVPELGVRVRMWDINGSPTPTPFDPLAQLNQEPVLTLSGQSQTGTPENPCRPGSAKHLVCEAAFAKNSAEKTKSGLEGLRPGSSRHLKQYIADLRSTNGLDIVISGGSVVYRGYLIGR